MPGTSIPGLRCRRFIPSTRRASAPQMRWRWAGKINHCAFPASLGGVESELAGAPSSRFGNKALQPGRKMDRRLLHRVMRGIFDLLDFRVRVERRIDAPHQTLADAIVKFTIQHEHARLDLSRIGRKIVLNERAHIALERL